MGRVVGWDVGRKKDGMQLENKDGMQVKKKDGMQGENKDGMQVCQPDLVRVRLPQNMIIRCVLEPNKSKQICPPD